MSKLPSQKQMYNDKIIIRNLAVNYRIGVTETERLTPQRLLLNLELYGDYSRAMRSDELHDTIDYFEVTKRLKALGERKEWRLIEKLAGDIAYMLIRDFGAEKVSVEVRKMVIPDTDYVAFVTHLDRSEEGSGGM